MRNERFEFDSNGETLIGTLYLPAGRAAAAVVTTGPLTSVKEQAAGTYAKAMAARGFAALAFDHRYFGESGGQPRQFENPAAKVEDVRNAVAALARDERTRGLAVGAVGVCAGGGYMARAVAEDSRIQVFAGVAGVYSDAAQTRQWMGQDFQAAIARAVAAEEQWQKTGRAETIPAVAPDGGDVAMPLREAYEFYGTSRGATPNYVNAFAVQSRAHTLPFDAQSIASEIRVPTLIAQSEKALMPGLARRFFASLTAPKEELWLGSEGQIDFYDDPRLFEPISDAILRFFTMALPR
jgi:fermentation-respiration switch protein FrsA (DUF1100 family)